MGTSRRSSQFKGLKPILVVGLHELPQLCSELVLLLPTHSSMGNLCSTLAISKTTQKNREGGHPQARELCDKSSDTKLSSAVPAHQANCGAQFVNHAGTNAPVHEDCQLKRNGKYRCEAYQSDLLGPPSPPCDNIRLKALHLLHQADAASDPEVGVVLDVARRIFGVPSALLCLIDDKRVFLTNTMGDDEWGDFPWRVCFCGWTLASQTHQTMVTSDILKDPRFCVTFASAMRSYCGAPVISSNGQRIGCLCLLDAKPREYDAGQAMLLNSLAELVARRMEHDLKARLQSGKEQDLQQAYNSCLERPLRCLDVCVGLVDTSQPNWKLVYTNVPWQHMTGMTRSHESECNLWDCFEDNGGRPVDKEPLQQYALAEHEFQVKHVCLRATSQESGGARKVLTLTFRPAALKQLDDDAIPVGIPPTLATQYSAAKSYYFVVLNEESEHMLPTTSSAIVPGAAVSHPSMRTAAKSPAACELTGLGPCALLRRAMRANEVDFASKIEGLLPSYLVGEGSYGPVYKATWLGEPVVIKVVETRLIQAKNACGFSLESILWQSLKHPHLLTIHKYMIHSRRSFDCFKHNLETHLGEFTVINTHNDTSLKINSAPLNKLPNTLDFPNQATSPRPTPSLFPSKSQQNRDPSLILVGSTTSVDADGAGNDGDDVHEGMHTCAIGSTAGTEVSFEPELVGAQAGGKGTPTKTSVSAEINITPLWPGDGGDKTVATLAAHIPVTWLVMELCDHGSVQDAIDCGWFRTDKKDLRSPPDLAAILVTAGEVAGAMSYLHQHGVIHGDLAARNVLLTTMNKPYAKAANRGFSVKVSDFGLSCAMEVHQRVERHMYGSLGHLAPETLTHGTTSKAADVYSFGVMLWKMYTGSRPWVGLTHQELIKQVGSGRASLRFPNDTPEGLKLLALSCMALEPHARLRFSEICRMLEPLCADLEKGEPDAVAS